MKMILMVIAPKDYQDIEYNTPKMVLTEGGVEVKTASLGPGMAQGFLGGEAKIDLVVDDVKVEDFDGVIFVGGQGMVDLVDNEKFVKLAKDFYEAGKITGAICVAPKILANAGLLEDKEATSWDGAEAHLKKHKAQYTGAAVTKDGLLITGNGPSAASEFGLTVLNALK